LTKCSANTEGARETPPLSLTQLVLAPAWRCLGLAVSAVVLTAASGCALIAGGTTDYVFAVAGAVHNAKGDPVEGVQVLLETNHVVYEGTESVRRQTYETNRYGGFQFTYITHRRNTPYVLSFKKSGYVHQTLTSTAPPSRKHRITLQPAFDEKASPDKQKEGS
jgi:hypothetical protein